MTRYVDRQSERLPLVVTPEKAEKMKSRSFWRGVVVGYAIAWAARIMAAVLA